MLAAVALAAGVRAVVDAAVVSAVAVARAAVV